MKGDYDIIVIILQNHICSNYRYRVAGVLKAHNTKIHSGLCTYLLYLTF